MRAYRIALMVVLGLLPVQRAAGLQTTRVRIIVDELECVHATDGDPGDANDHDEIYFHVSEQGKPGTPVRVPGNWKGESEPIYEFAAQHKARGWGWQRRDKEPMPAPVLWEGTIQRGSSTKVAIAVREQDNADLKKITELFNSVAGLLDFPTLPNFGKEHDVLGIFSVVIENHVENGPVGVKVVAA